MLKLGNKVRNVTKHQCYNEVQREVKSYRLPKTENFCVVKFSCRIIKYLPAKRINAVASNGVNIVLNFGPLGFLTPFYECVET